MDLEYVPLLPTQRGLHDIPRGMERFRAYLAILQTDAKDEVRLPPLVAANPMAKDHVRDRLDELIAIDAEGVAARAAAQAATRLVDVPGSYKIGLVVADDVGGGWTNRYATEYGLRFRPGAGLKRGWISAVLWSSETASADLVRETVQAAIFRAAWWLRHGEARTLRERLAQEGWSLAEAGAVGPSLDPDDLDYTRAVVAEHLDAEDDRTSIECLFGDAAARTLGMTPRGLSPWAGIALALADARAARRPLVPGPPAE